MAADVLPRLLYALSASTLCVMRRDIVYLLDDVVLGSRSDSMSLLAATPMIGGPIHPLEARPGRSGRSCQRSVVRVLTVPEITPGRRCAGVRRRAEVAGRGASPAAS